MEKVKIGISVGDINGIGLEVILKALSNKLINNQCIPIIYATSKVVAHHKNTIGLEFRFHNIHSALKAHVDKINVINICEDQVDIDFGKASEMSGKFAIQSLDAAAKDLKEGLIDGIVTAPIHKFAMKKAGFAHPGHTEFLTHYFGEKESLMLLVRDNLRVGLVTNHLPISEIATTITKGLIIEKVNIFNSTLKRDFGIERPLIAVLGLNPHAGDSGAIGTEEETIIRPAIIELKKKGIMVMGPFPADGFFGSSSFLKYDGILAMYHDQGLAPFKALTFGEGMNFTAGLPVVRTSPDHGTALDIAGQDKANPASFRKALYGAIDIYRNRKKYDDDHQNPVEMQRKERRNKK